MKAILLAVVLFLVTLGATLWALRVFSPPGPPAPSTPEGPGAAPAAAPGATATAPGLAAGEPAEEPPLIAPIFDDPLRVIVLVETTRSFSQFLPQLWGGHPNIGWQFWYGESAPAGATTHAPSVPPLNGPPTEADLDAAKVLVLAGVDPARLTPEFWASVAGRVRARRLGLLVLPEHRFANAYADEPSLRGVLPVAEVRPVAPIAPGSAVLWGVYEQPRGFEPTDEGRLHPATRLVASPGWSERIWAGQRTGAGAWTTKFCASVTGPAPGAAVLVELVGGEGRAPAVLASGPDAGRVLWAGGFFDLSWDAYHKDLAAYDRMAAMASCWVAWLANLM